MPEAPTEILPLGKPGESCEECGAPLAVDQRYCLNCGHRRGESRVDYRAVMGASSAPGTAAGAAPGAEPAGSFAPAAGAASPNGSAAPGIGGETPGRPEGKRERDLAPLAAVGGIAVLGLMLLVGVLIGRDNSGSGSSATPQVVRVPAAAAGGAAESAAAETGAEAGGSKKGAKSGSGSGKPAAKSQGLGNGGKGDSSVHEASSSELEALEDESGEDAAKKSLELPNKIATEGKPPPIDKSKPPAGGEKGITIK